MVIQTQIFGRHFCENEQKHLLLQGKKKLKFDANDNI